MTMGNALKPGETLAAEKVQALSISRIQDKHFFSGSVEAQMKKDVIYIIKIVVQTSAEIIFSLCECAAGAGPNATCKHIIAGE